MLWAQTSFAHFFLFAFFSLIFVSKGEATADAVADVTVAAAVHCVNGRWSLSLALCYCCCLFSVARFFWFPNSSSFTSRRLILVLLELREEFKEILLFHPSALVGITSAHQCVIEHSRPRFYSVCLISNRFYFHNRSQLTISAKQNAQRQQKLLFGFRPILILLWLKW